VAQQARERLGERRDQRGLLLGDFGQHLGAVAHQRGIGSI
jgi:hypothetical protein